MAGKVSIKAKDILSGAEAECYVTIDGKRYNFASATSVNAKITKKKVKNGVLGRTGKVNRTVGWEGTGTIKLYFNNSIFRKKMVEYIKTGKDFYFDLQTTNEDATTELGRQTTILLDCNIDSIDIASFDVDGDTLTEEMPFTFDDCELPEKFNDLAVMG